MKLKDETEKADLKLSIQKPKIVASSPITSWPIDGKTMETVRDIIFVGSKITAMVTAAMKLKDDYSLEKKVMTNLDSILKSSPWGCKESDTTELTELK